MDKLLLALLLAGGVGILLVLKARERTKPSGETGPQPVRKDLRPEDKQEIEQYFKDYYAWRAGSWLRANLALFIHLDYEDIVKLKETFPEKELPDLFMGKFSPVEATTEYLRKLAREKYGLDPGDEKRQPIIEKMIKEHLERKAIRAVLDEIAKYVKHPEDKEELEKLRKEHLGESP